MTKGRNAAKTFNATRAARFADSRRAAEEKRQAEREAGTRRSMVMVDVEDVRDDDEVFVEGVAGTVSAVDNRDRMVVVNGQTAVMRFER